MKSINAYLINIYQLNIIYLLKVMPMSQFIPPIRCCWKIEKVQILDQVLLAKIVFNMKTTTYTTSIRLKVHFVIHSLIPHFSHKKKIAIFTLVSL